MNINATIIGQAITFAILIWFTMKFVWPPIVAALEERARKVADGLAAAEQARKDLVQAEQRSGEALAEARVKAAEIIALSEKQRNEIIAAAREEATAEANRVKAQAQAELAQEVQRARDALRDQVSDLVVAGAEKILRREINAQVHSDLLAAIRAEI